MKKIVVVLMGLWLFPTDALSRNILVSVSEVAPCAFFNDGQLQGFSVDLWKAIAREIDLPFQYTVLPFREKLDSLSRGEADVAIACISITAEREAQFDFAGPTLSSGIQAASLKESNILKKLSWQFWSVVVGLFLMAMLFGVLFYLMERRAKNTQITTLEEGLFLSLTTMSTVGYGRCVPVTTQGRILAVLLMFVGISYFGYVVGEVFLIRSKEEANVNFTSATSLKKFRIATKKGTTSEAFLIQSGMEKEKMVLFETGEEIFQSLLNKEVDLAVYDHVSVLHATSRNAAITAAGPLFAPHDYGFAFPSKSSLRETVDQALLRLKEDGIYQKIKQKWFE